MFIEKSIMKIQPMMKHRFFIRLLAIIMMSVASLSGCHSPPSEEVTRCPDFSLADLQGQTHHSSEWQGKVVIFNFWATWCPPCVREIPLFIELQQKYADRGLQFVGIATSDPPQVVAEFVEDNGINYPILIGEGEAVDVAVNLGNRFGSLPFTAIVDREGNIVLRKVGEIKRKKLEQMILPLL